MEFQQFHNEEEDGVEENKIEQQNQQVNGHEQPQVDQEMPKKKVNDQTPDIPNQDNVESNDNMFQAQDTLRRRGTMSFSDARREQRPAEIANKAQNVCGIIMKLCFYITLIYVIESKDLKQQQSINEQVWVVQILKLGLYGTVIDLIYAIFAGCCGPNPLWALLSFIPNLAISGYSCYLFITGFSINSGLPEVTQHDSNFVHFLYIVLLIFGVFLMVTVTCFTCCLCAIVGSTLKQGQTTKAKRASILKNIKGIPFLKQLFPEGRDCPICLTAFRPDEQIIQLKCHTTHIYHDECIQDWIKQGNLLCPLCRVPIE